MEQVEPLALQLAAARALAAQAATAQGTALASTASRGFANQRLARTVSRTAGKVIQTVAAPALPSV